MTKFKKLNICLVAILMLLFAGIATILSVGTTSSKYYKSVSTKLNLIAYSDKPYSYYLYDNNGASIGHYNNANSISQQLTTREKSSETIYQIKLPVSEEGYYTLKFNVDFVRNNAGQDDLMLGTRMTYAIGCQIVNASQAQKALVMTPGSRNTAFSHNRPHSMQASYSTDGRYQWKTLAPSLAEDVELTFKVTNSDVNSGYMLWSWEFSGMPVSTTCVLNLSNISSEKITELDDDNLEPYFNFAQTNYVNNAINPTASDTVSTDIGGNSVAGFTRNAPGKGTFVTNATAHSLTMQLSPLYSAWNNSKNQPMLGTDTEDGRYQNYVGLNIPIKNIEYDTNYKVSFDFSIARQGTRKTHNESTELSDVVYDSNYDNFFHEFASTNTSRALTFQSYIHSGTITGHTWNDHSAGRSQIIMANKSYPAHEVSRYDELRFYETNSADYKEYQYNSKLNINYLGNERGSNANMFNSVRHTEVNGQNEIYWYTFSNTTFTFNISSDANTNLDLDDLYWVWAIDALAPSNYFRIKIENVRIEKVVQFGGDISQNGIKINGKQVENFNHAGNDTTNYGPENYLRGSSGTGQNYQALAYGTGVSMSAINTFAPIYDAKDVAFTTDSADDYKIEIDGYCVCDSGIEKYVWSPDLGKTWHDMIIKTPLTQVDKATMELAERRVDQSQVSFKDGSTSRGSTHDETRINETVDANGYHTQTNDKTTINGYTYDFDHIDFEVSDTKNSDFSDFKLCADISAYKHVWNMEIIFAAVPVDHSDMRCEILRITNVNSKERYVSTLKEIRSDIEVSKNINQSATSTDKKYINAIEAGKSTGDANWADATYSKAFSQFTGLTMSGTAKSDSGYASKTNLNSISETRTIFSGIPIKNKITLEGWTIIKNGAENYWFSVDDGKTWKQITNARVASRSVTTPALVNKFTDWMKVDSEELTTAETDTCYHVLTIDLSEYAGQLVNMMVAAKPNGKDALCPLAKIDNISVCGDHLYYSRFDSIEITQSDSSVLTLNANGAGNGMIDNSQIGLTATSINKYFYSYYEPYSIDLFATRKVSSAPLPVAKGGKISIDGFVVGTGGIKEYKFTTDNGETWLSINTSTFSSANDNILQESRIIDFSFNTNSSVNGNFSTANGSSKKLELNIPITFNVGEKLEIMVVAVSNDGSQALYPIMNATLIVQ